MAFDRLMKTLGAMAFVLILAACGNTWSGLKEDTGENLEAAGEAAQEAGEDIEDSAQ